MEGFNVHRSNSQSSLWSSVSSRHFGGRWGDGAGGGSEGWGYGEGGWKWGEVDRFEVCLRCGEERKVDQHVHYNPQSPSKLGDMVNELHIKSGSGGASEKVMPNRQNEWWV